MLALGLASVSSAKTKPVKCVARDGVRSMTLSYLKKDLSFLEIYDGTKTYRCPFRTLKIEDKKPKAERSVRVHLKAAGSCDPKLSKGTPAMRQAMVLQIDLKGPNKTAQMRDPKFDMGTPCELEDFRLEMFGLKAK